MRSHYPDRWVVLKFSRENKQSYKVFAGWYGGYTQGDSWKLNSGITGIHMDASGDYAFEGASGSTYYCKVSNHGMGSYMSSVLAGWQAEQPDLKIEEIAVEAIVVS